MPTPRPRKRTSAPRRRVSGVQQEDAAFDVSEESMLPGGVAVEDPVGSPHVDEEPGAIAPPILAAGDEDDGEDLHALWEEREASHARKRLQLHVVVGATMIAIIGVWALSLGESIGTIPTVAGTNDSETFFDRLRSYEDRLRDFSSGAANAPEGPSNAFVESLKVKVTEAAATTTETVGGRR